MFLFLFPCEVLVPASHEVKLEYDVSVSLLAASVVLMLMSDPFLSEVFVYAMQDDSYLHSRPDF